MICVECGNTIYDKGGYVDGLVICEKCISQYAETEQIPQPKIVRPNFHRVARRRHYTMDRR